MVYFVLHTADFLSMQYGSDSGVCSMQYGIDIGVCSMQYGAVYAFMVVYALQYAACVIASPNRRTVAIQYC